MGNCLKAINDQPEATPAPTGSPVTTKKVDLMLIDPDTVPSLHYQNEPIEARVVDIYDGDTCTVIYTIQNNVMIKQKIRIIGIDTPEVNRASALEKQAGAKVREYVRQLMLDQMVILTLICHDKYGGRVDGEIQLANGASLGQHLIEKKYAKPFDGKSKKVAWLDHELQSIIRN